MLKVKKNTLLLILIAVCFSRSALIAQDRNCDPVVLTGQEAICMLNEQPADIVAFKYLTGNGWTQIPLQIDERVLMDIYAPYDSVELDSVRAAGKECLRRSIETLAWDVLFYADARSHVGADTIPSFDSDDEIVFMQTDVGEKSAAVSYPTGTTPGSVCEISVTDPLTNNTVLGYVYLFIQDGSLDQAAGMDYISYNFTYANNYLTDYVECKGNDIVTNAETSLISTTDYELGFSQRWTEDVFKIKTGNATGQDILDRHQMFINAGTCNSTEDGFSANQGAHIAFIDGPVRAIRSVMGASSGVLTQLDILATTCQVNYNMYFRLHPANGFNDVYDLNSYASGKMDYYSEQSPSGAAVDGSMDAITITDPDDWQLYDGTPGSLIISWDYDTDMTVGTSSTYNRGNGTADCDLLSYYEDRGMDAFHDCTGDQQAYGSSGFTLRTKQCTDQRYDWNQYEECNPDNVNFFYINRVHYIQPPGATPAIAAQYAGYAKNPLETIVTDGEGVAQNGENCPTKKVFLNETLTMDSVYRAADTISTTAMVAIALGATVTFDAGAAVILGEGFSAPNGSTFTAKIGGCQTTLRSDLEQRSNAVKLQNALKIFPNPLRQSTTIIYELQDTDTFSLQLFDLNGQLIRVLQSSTVAVKGEFQYNLDASGLMDGLYVVVLQTNEAVVSQRISVVH